MILIEILFEAAKDERDQLLEKNKKLDNALNTMLDKYSSTLKKLTIVQVEILKAWEGLTRELDYWRLQKAITLIDGVPTAVNWRKQGANFTERLSGANPNKWNP